MPTVRIILSILILVSCSLAAETPGPSDDNLRLIARELYGRGLLDRFEYSAIGDVSSDSLDGFESTLESRFRALMDNYSSSENIPGMRISLEALERNYQGERSQNYLKLSPRARIDFSDRLSANILYTLDHELADDPRYEGESWSGFAGLAENATLDYKTSDFDIRFGIETISWGHGRQGNLMFASEAMPMTVLAASYRRSIFDFETVIGFLDPLREPLGDIADTSTFVGQQRYVSAHSLTIKPLRGLSVSLREAVLYGGQGRRLEPAYVFPFVWYHGQQLNGSLDDNIFSSVAADYRIPRRLWFYGEFLIDDFQIEKKSRGDYEPDQLAYLIGGEAYDLAIPATTVSLEYVRVNNWTFIQSAPHNRYVNAGFPIGFPGGPDGEFLNWTASWWRHADFKLSYFGSLSGRGEGRIDSPWSRPWLEVDGYSEPFPTGIVEKTAVNGIGLLALYKNRFWGNIGLKFTDIINVANTPGKNDSCWELKLDIGIKLPPVSWEF